METTQPRPISSREWHLLNLGQAGGKRGADCNVTPAWRHTCGDPSVTIAVIDDGFDLTHPGLCGQGKYRDAYDAANARRDPPPDSIRAAHGTACAELAVGTGHGGTIQGTAPGCTWMPIRIGGRVGDPHEVRAFQHALERGADIISCSWGALDGVHSEPCPIPKELSDVIRRCSETGRDGRGIPVFFAAGNGNEPVELDGYANNPDVICVSATTNQNDKASCGDYGRNVWLTAPSGGGTLDIPTTASTGGVFGSTSAAAALAAGIAGLMLSVNPQLSARALRDILRDTAAKPHNDRKPLNYKNRWGHDYHDGYDDRGHSLVFGWGRIDAGAAVARALSMRVE